MKEISRTRYNVFVTYDFHKETKCNSIFIFQRHLTG
jgi:hypothetical protein